MAADQDTVDPKVALEREFAKAALTGMMVYAAQHQWAEDRVAEWAWKVAREMVDSEGKDFTPPPPPPPVRGRR
jgi:hypothetical protein